MKGKFTVLLLFLFLSFLLVGCEDLSTFTTTGSETVTTTVPSTSVTTTVPATGVTTTAPATGVTTTVPATGVTTTIPVSTVPVTTAFFDHSLLVGAIMAMDGSGEMTEAEAEEQIGMMTMILGISEAELYEMVIEAPTVISGLQSIETLADFQTWYADVKTVLTKEMLTDALANVMLMMATEAVENPETDYLLQEISDHEDALAAAIAELANVRADVVVYANTHTTNPTAVIDFYDALVANNVASSEYYQAKGEYFYDKSWDESEDYYDLEDLMWDYYYYLYDYVDTELANQAIGDYNDLLATFSPEKQVAYGILIDLYETYLMSQFSEVRIAQAAVEGLEDTITEEMVINVMNNTYFSDYYEWSGEVNTHQWVLVELEEQLEQAEMMLAFMELFVDYLGSVDGATTVKLVVIDLYDMIDALIVNLDEDVFNLIYGMIFSAPLEGESMSQVQQIQMLLDYVDEFGAILSVIQTEMDSVAIGHLSDLLEDVVTIYIQSLDLPLVDETAMLTLVLPKIDEYLGIADEVFDELAGFIQSIDEDKIAAITAFIEMMIPEEEIEPVVMMSMSTQDEMFYILVEAAKLAQTLIGDGSLDLSMIVDHLITIYFDVEYALQPDPDQVALIRSLVVGNVDTMLGMIDDIALIDVESPSIDDIMMIQEFIERAQAFTDIFRYGFEVAEEWEFGIQHEDILEFVVGLFGDYDMTELEAEALLADLLVIFDMDTEEDFYAFMLGMMFHVSSLPNITTYDDLLAWYDYFEASGMTNQAIAEILVNLLEFQMEREASDEGHYANEIAWLEEMIADNEAGILDFQEMMDDLSTEINNQLVNIGYEQPEIDLYISFWQASLLMIEYEEDYWRLEADIRWSDNPIYDEETYWMIVNTLNDVFEGYEEQTTFDAIFAALSTEEQDLYQPMVTLLVNKHNHQVNTLQVLEAQVDTAGIYGPIEWLAEGSLSEYRYFYNQVSYMTDEIGWYENDILKLQGEIAFAGEMVTYLSDPFNKQLIVDVILIAFDELENLMLGLDNPTVDLLIEYLMSQSYEYEGDPVDIDLSPEAIVGYLDDLLPVIGGLLSAIDATDQLKIKTLIMDIAEMRLPYEGMGSEEVTGVLTLIDVVFDKYFPRVQEVVDIFVAALDGLDATQIATIVDLITSMSDEESDPSQAAIMVAVSQIIDILAYDEGTDPLLDFETLLDYLVEGYFDITYMFDYNTVDMEALQDVMYAIATDMIDFAHDAALIDLEDVQVADLELLYNMYIYVGTLSQAEGFEDVEHPVTLFPFVPEDHYSHEGFVDLVQDHNDWMLSPSEVDDEIDRLSFHYGATTELEAYLYTFFLGYVYEEVPAE